MIEKILKIMKIISQMSLNNQWVLSVYWYYFQIEGINKPKPKVFFSHSNILKWWIQHGISHRGVKFETNYTFFSISHKLSCVNDILSCVSSTQSKKTLHTNIVLKNGYIFSFDYDKFRVGVYPYNTLRVVIRSKIMR